MDYKKMYFGYNSNYNQPFVKGGLPDSIEGIEFGPKSSFNQPFEVDTLP
jgi:hypothetical protein